MPIMDPALVAKELEKPIDLDGEMRRYYSLPPSGQSSTVTYSLKDRWQIARETERLYKKLTKTLTKNTDKRFTITSGGPGSGKTTLIRKMQEKGGALENAAHVDADELLNQFKPYKNLSTQLGNTDVGRAVAYTYWRSASIYMMNTILNKLADDGYDIVLGTTGTSPAVKFVYQAAKKLGYKTDLVIVHAHEETRLDGVAKRFETERRFTPEIDVKEKGNRMFPEVVGLHFATADTIRVFWRGQAGDPVLAAETDKGRVVTRDAAALKEFTSELQSRKADFNWQQAVTAYESRFAKPAPKNAPKP